MPTRGRCAVDLNVEVTVDAQRQVVLGYLVPLHEVGIGVVLAVELGVFGDFAVQRQAGADGVVHGFAVDDRQHAGHAEADGADVGVGPGVGVVGGAAAEHLAAGAELDVGFQADDGAVGGGDGHAASMAFTGPFRWPRVRS